MKLAELAAACAAVLAAACGGASEPDDDTARPGAIGTVSGALSEASAAAMGSTVLVSSVDDDGRLSLVGQGVLDARGHFRVQDVDAGEGPFVVQVIGSRGAKFAAVIVPEDIDDGAVITTHRLSAETTAEAGALIDILGGDTDTDEVDTITLMTWITAELATSSDTDTLAHAVSLASATWLQTAAAQGEAITAAAAERAKLEAWATFTASGTASAWADFLHETADGARADAQAAAGLVFAASFDGSGAHRAAVNIAARLGAYASWSAQNIAVAGSSVAAAVNARLDLAYQGFFDALAEAGDRVDIDSATVELTTAINATMDVLIAGEDVGAEADVHGAIDATTHIALTFQGAIDGALGGAIDPNAVANAYADFRADLEDSLDASLDVSGRVQAFVDELTAQGGHLAALLGLDLDLLDIIGDVTGEVAVSGAIDAGLGDTGAIGLDGLDGSFDAAASATVAVLLGVIGDQATPLEEGAIEGGRFVFDSVIEADGTFVVELRDPMGNVEGALRFDDIRSDLGALSQETTVEARVFLARLDRGEHVDDIDAARLEALIDGAVAAAVSSDDDIDVLADATSAAEQVADSNSDENGARAEAAIAFQTVVDVMSDNPLLHETSDARAHLEGAFALQSAFAMFSGSRFGARGAQLDGSIAALVAATASAKDSHALDLAAATWVNGMLGFASAAQVSDGLFGDMVEDDLRLDLAQQLVIETAIDRAFAAGVTFWTAISAVAEVQSAASLDASAFGSGWAIAKATFDTTLATALDLSTLTLDQADANVLTALVTHLTLSFSGVYAGR